MPTLAPAPRSKRLSRHAYVGPDYGTAAEWVEEGSELHGRELRTVIKEVHEARRRNAELGTELVNESVADDFDYTPVPAVRSYYVDAVFVRGCAVAPLPFDYNFDEE